MASNIYWKLVRHEFRWATSGKKGKRKVSGKWWAAYVAFVILTGFVVLTYASDLKDFHIENIWFFSLGLPYIIFFMGHSLIKKEWDNETQGWWLSLPYSRQTLVGAKFTGSLLQSWCMLAGIYVLATIYAVYITMIQSDLTAANLWHFMAVGFNWIFMLAILSPIITGLGLTVSLIPYTVLRPIVPALWFLFMGAGSFLYWGLGSPQNNNKFFTQFSGDVNTGYLNFPIYMYGIAVLGWILAYLLIRLLGYLLDHKLSL
ncbi:MAG: ABC-2 transporter permease [Tuberibacillus sp.]